MQNELQLDILPDLPQRATIGEITAHIWQNYDVVALWLGGSLARGAGDAFSDIDFRVAVEPQHLESWKTPQFENIFTSSTVVGQQFLPFGDDAFLHHLILANGEIVDFFVQSSTQKPEAEVHLILECRDEHFRQLLIEESQLAPIHTQAAQAGEVQKLLVNFWINTHKHRKVLHRKLDLIVNFGLDLEKSFLLRLLYIERIGEDCGDLRRQTIHSLSRLIGALEQAVGSEAREMIGKPTRNRQELYQAIEYNREVVSQIGRRLAHTYGFAYPVELETTVLQGWQDFLAAR